MNHVWKSTVVGFATLTLASCAGVLPGLELQKAELVEPSGSPFDNALARDYLQLSQDEYREGDYVDSDVFAIASMNAAGGGAVAPEEISSRPLPEDSIGELTAARGRLMAALNASAKQKIPEEAARAQACFDGWMQEQEENFQPEDIALRRDCFNDAMAKVEAAMAGMPRQPAYLVFFDWDKSNLTPEAVEIVQNAVANARAMNAASAVVTGYTDTSGSAAYNLILSRRRADSVKAEMVRLGFPGTAIRTLGRGQNDLLVPTADGVREAQNRRASIELQK